MRYQKTLLPAVAAVAFLLAATGLALAAMIEESPLQSKLRTPITCHFDAAPMREVVEYFREALDVNMVYDPPSREERFITLHVTDMPAQSALHWAARLARLEYNVAHDAIYISTRENITQSAPTYFRQYEVRDLLVFRGTSGKGDDDDDDAGGSVSPERELVQLIVLFTGPQNWDRVEVMGVSDKHDDESESRDDSF